MSTENRRKKEIAARREEILLAAQELFALRGYHQTSVDDIAKASNLAKGTLYLYFKNKEELFLKLAQKRHDELFLEIDKAIKENDKPYEKVYCIVKAQLAFFERNNAFFKIVMASRGSFDPGLKENLEKLHRRIMNHCSELVGLLGEIISKCKIVFITDDFRFLGALLLGMINSAIMQWMMTGRPAGLTSKADLICRIFFKGTRKK